MKAYRHLVKFALNKGCTISVWDGEEWQVKRSTDFHEIIDAIESVEEAELVIRNKNCDITWARVSAYGLEDDETVVDYYVNDFTKEWEKSYTQTQKA